MEFVSTRPRVVVATTVAAVLFPSARESNADQQSKQKQEKKKETRFRSLHFLSFTPYTTEAAVAQRETGKSTDTQQQRAESKSNELAPEI